MKQLTTYFALAYGISWLIWLPLYGHIFGLEGLPILPFHHGIGGLGPLIASFLATWIYSGAEGVKGLLQKCSQATPLAYLLIALLSPFVLALFAGLMGYFIDQSPLNFAGLLASKEFPEFSFVAFALYNLVFFGFGEEVGWRGFALPRLSQKQNALTASLVLTIFWALWHWPLFFYRPGYLSMEVAGIFGWVFSLLTGSVLLTWLFNSSKGSILICAIFHSTIDIAFTADFTNKNMTNYMGFLITLWGIATIFIYKPRLLSQSKQNS